MAPGANYCFSGEYHDYHRAEHQSTPFHRVLGSKGPAIPLPPAQRNAPSGQQRHTIYEALRIVSLSPIKFQVPGHPHHPGARQAGRQPNRDAGTRDLRMNRGAVGARDARARRRRT